jgi:uncharacterized protein YjbJ (UPF0337 family)
MSNTSKRIKGAARQVGGKVKAAVGGAIGNERMQAEGKASELGGKAQKEAAKAAERVKGAAEQVTGAVKRGVGKVIDNEQMEVEGRAKELKGSARRKANS